MSRIDQLIKELCPNGVQYKTIGEIAVDLYRGSGIKRNQLTDSGTPCVRYGEIYTTYDIWFSKCHSHTNLKEINNPKFFNYGDILFAITGESVEEIAKSCAYIGEEKCLAGGDIVVLKHNQNPKYLAYALETSDARIQKSAGKVKSKVVHSSVPAISKIRVPIPPLPLQEEIVRILDSFTELEAELEAELEERKKQYEYYRDNFLSFDKNDDKVKWIKLGEICEVLRGKRLTTRDLSNEEKYPVFHGGNIPIGYYHTYNRMANSTMVINVGASAGTIGYSDIDFWSSDGCFCFSHNDCLVQKYLFYYLQSIEHTIKSKVRKAGIPTLDSKVLEQLLIPVLPIDRQQEIIRILSRFELICNDLSVGLPAEIQARRKQYEYYRDKLLTFK